VADATFTGIVAKDAWKFGVFSARPGRPANWPRRAAGLMQLTGDNLVCSRGGREVFRGVSFTLKGGEALLVTGRNGAGKSSLLRMIAGLVRVAGGTLALDGGEREATIGEQAHYLGHLDALKTALTVAENLQFWSEFMGPASFDVEPALQAVELAQLSDLPAAYLSAGQRRRLSIARLVAVPRAIWLLDEPTSALDAGSQTRLAGLMRRHLNSGGMIIAAAHGAIGLETARELKIGPQ
jgi:heme exporter protein A